MPRLHNHAIAARFQLGESRGYPIFLLLTGFHKAHASLKHHRAVVQGLELGIAICRHIVKDGHLGVRQVILEGEGFRGVALATRAKKS